MINCQFCHYDNFLTLNSSGNTAGNTLKMYFNYKEITFPDIMINGIKVLQINNNLDVNEFNTFNINANVDAFLTFISGLPNGSFIALGFKG